MSEPYTICLAFPIDDGARSEFWKSLTSLILGKDEYFSDEPVSFLLLNLCGDSLITRARNNLAHDFLHKTNADYLLFIDSDLDFTLEDIKTLITKRKRMP